MISMHSIGNILLNVEGNVCENNKKMNDEKNKPHDEKRLKQ